MEDWLSLKLFFSDMSPQLLELIAMKSCTDNHGAQRITTNDSGDFQRHQ